MSNLRNYYQNYYNNNYMRDIFHFRPHKKPLSRRYWHYNESEDNLNSFLSFLTDSLVRKENGLFAARIGYYKTLNDFKEYKTDTIHSDRLFFDFDVEDERIDSLKEKLLELDKNKQAIPSERQSIWDKYQQLILEEDVLRKPFRESKNLCDFLQQQGLKPYLTFSGSKGFHCNLFFQNST